MRDLQYTDCLVEVLLLCRALSRAVLAGVADDPIDMMDMINHFPALQAELCETFGEEGPLPKLSTLQRMNRKDLEEVRV